MRFVIITVEILMLYNFCAISEQTSREGKGAGMVTEGRKANADKGLRKRGEM